MLNDISIDKIKDFEEEYLVYLMNEHKETLNQIKQGKLTDEIIQVLEDTCNQIKKNYVS